MKNLAIIAIVLVLTACVPNYNDAPVYHTPIATQHEKSFLWVNYLKENNTFFNEPTVKFSQLNQQSSNSGNYYIELEVNRYTGLVYESIPWTSLLSFEFIKLTPHKDIPSKYLLLLTSYSEKDKGEYLGVNAFGVTKNVTITDGKYNGILIIPHDKKSYNDFTYDLILHNQNKIIEDYYKTSATNAEFRWDKNIRIVAKANIYLGSGGLINGTTTIYKTPTLDDPVKSTNKYNFISVDLESIIYIDKKTNKVLVKFEKY